MPSGLPARLVLIVCAVSPGVAHAERRPVAVIDLSEDDAAIKLSGAIYDAVRVSDDLMQPQHTFDVQLRGKLLDEDAPRIATARTDLETAHQTEQDPATEAGAAKAGMRELANATPTSETIVLYADLAFAWGQAEINAHNPPKKPNESLDAFALVSRLDPNRVPDEVRYPPEIIGPYKKAKALTPATVKLTIESAGKLWIDGTAVGTAPGTFDVAAGYHLVQLTGPDIVTTGDLVKLDKDDTTKLEAAPADDNLKVQRARLALARATDETERAGAMRHLAELLDVHDAVLISKQGDKLVGQTWRDRAPGFSKFVDITQKTQPAELLAPLIPPKPPEPPKPPPIHPPPPLIIEKPWYEATWVKPSAVATGVAALLGVILWARRDQFISVDTNPTGQMGHW